MWLLRFRWLLFSYSLSLLFTGGRGFIFETIDLAKNVLFNRNKDTKNTDCPSALVRCRCGKTNTEIEIQIPQCTKYVRFKARCLPCDGMTADKICPIFQYCTQCSSEEGGRCTECIKGKYGDFCEKQCDCHSRAGCNKEGVCICPPGYGGRRCEQEVGCDPPKRIEDPVSAEFRPAIKPSTIVYSCPSDYEMEGMAISSCSPDGTWSTPPPRCLTRCPPLSEPANGHLNYSGPRLLEGVTAEVTCDENYQLVGQSVLTCMKNEIWDAHVPLCEALAECHDPGDVAYATRTAPDTQPNGRFLQDDEIHYVCMPGFQQMGTDKILCLPDESWSRDVPTCVKASPVTPDCKTNGSELVNQLGIPVSIYCSPECANEDVPVWGTSIYRMGSSVCAAAIHAGKLTNSGGTVAVINNGGYTHFTGSSMNNIVSETYEERDESFRFDKVLSLNERKRQGQCPRGLERLENTCIHISSYALPQKQAESTCTNLGMKMSLPSEEADLKRVQSILPSKGIDKIWTGDFLVKGNNTNETLDDYELACESVEVVDFEFVNDAMDCDGQLHFICTYQPTENLLASCEDPGPIEGGVAKSVGKMEDMFFVGSSIEYSCESLHYLKGASKIYCRANGTWSDKKPTCIRVASCEGPPVPTGGIVNYQPPLKSQSAQRSALRANRLSIYRAPRLPQGLNLNPPPPTAIPTATPDEPSVPMPPGRYRVGMRAVYECESRYYSLVGSKTRRCESSGQWSGRPPTCIPVCGRSDSPRTPFIVNGNASDIGQWPWQAGLARYIPDYDLWYMLCGGSLLNERWVVTAAHCITYSGTTLPIDADKFRVYLGKYHRSDSKDDEYVQVRTIREMHIHPDYEPQIYDSDIALLLLDTPAQLNTRVQPVCLPTERSSEENLATGSEGVVTGWGMNENQTSSETLQQAVVPVISNRACEEGYEEVDLPLSVTDNMFCAGYKQGRVDSCSGDSGGPVVFLDKESKERKWLLEGIVSWGSPNGCGQANQYGGYTKVIKFLDWIHLFF